MARDKLSKFPNWINHRAYLLAKEALANPELRWASIECLDAILANKPRAVGNSATPQNKYLGRMSVPNFLKRWGWSCIRQPSKKHSSWVFDYDNEWLEAKYLKVLNQTPEEYIVKEVY